MLLGLALPGWLARWDRLGDGAAVATGGVVFFGARVSAGGGNHGLFSGRQSQNLRGGSADEYDDIKMRLT